jgi:DtxR family transcriptional regulator, Mn-dependent transcriptional regulator
LSNLSITEENYLKAIYTHTQNTQWVNTNTIADAITIKASSVTDMLKKLKSKKLILYKPYEGCKLSSEGEKIALQIIRKHRLWETFLHQTLGFDWNEVHAIAEELEHIGNIELIRKLDAHLGFPETDPHGDLIPDENGVFPKIITTALANKNENANCSVKAVHSHEKGVLALLNHYGIVIGSKIKVVQKFEYDDSIAIIVDNVNECVLPSKLANNILVD